jgi:hypothetical protein
VADRSSQLVLTALSRAAADGTGVPLYSSKSTPGLFPTSALGKQAAQRCCDEGYLQQLPEGTARSPRCALTDKGRAYLFSQVSPRQVLEDFVRALESREAQLAGVSGLVRQVQASFEALRANVAPVLEQLRQGGPTGLNGLFQQFHNDTPNTTDPTAPLLAALERWSGSSAADDCPLPELFRQVQGSCPGLSLGAFHDCLRRLQDEGRLYLHPWTGPLYDMPEPACALLVGHTVDYYASIRKDV